MTKNTLIKDYSTALVKGFYEKALSIKRVRHRLTKGEFRELFLTDLLSNFLTDQIGIGGGIIVDAYGNESKQTDIVIYDKRILPAIINTKNLGTYPIESVLFVIEVKSNLTLSELKKSEQNFKYLDETLKFHGKFQNSGFTIRKGIIGINNKAIKQIKNNDDSWLKKNIFHTDLICHIQNCSWVKYPNNAKWVFQQKNERTFEETKRFVAWTLDISRNKSIARQKALAKETSWLSLYIRNQES